MYCALLSDFNPNKAISVLADFNLSRTTATGRNLPLCSFFQIDSGMAAA
jgi:hypothetical protein